MKFIRQFESWKKNNKIHFLVESVVNIDSNIKELLSSFDNHPDSKFKLIAKTLIDAIGADYPKNKYDLITRSQKDPNKFDVKMGKQINPLNIAKVIRTLLVSVGVEVGKTEIKDDTVQKFADELVGKLKSTNLSSSKNADLQLVSGDKILWCYDRTNTNEKKGSELFKSCMAGASKNDFMEIYRENSDKINLLVKMVDGKVDARALVWKVDYSTVGNKWYLDRCYCNDNTDKELLFEWLKKEKGEGVARHEVISGPAWDSKSESLDVVKLQKVLFKYYPYIDTFNYLTIKKNGSTLEDVGVLSTQEIKCENTEVISFLGDEYKWLSDEKIRANFKCRDTQGKRRGINQEDIDLENQTKKLKFNGYKFQLVKGVPLAEFKNVTKAIQMISQNNDPTSIVEVEEVEDVTGLIDFGGIYFEEKDCLDTISSAKIPAGLAVKVAKIGHLWEQDIAIPTKVMGKSISIRKLYEMMDLHGSYTGIRDSYNENAGYGKLLTELDCYILGIQDKVDTSPSNLGKTWGYVDTYYTARSNTVTDMLSKMFGESEYIKLRRNLTENQKLLDPKEWLKMKKKLEEIS